MAKPIETRKRKPNSKAVAAITLAVILILTLASAFIGVNGMKLDKEGLYKLLAWIPTPLQSSTWREALVPGTDLGENRVQTYMVGTGTEGELASEEQLKETVNVLTRRLLFGGWNSAQAEVIDGNKIRLSLPLDGTHDHAFEMLAAKGEFALADPEGKAFLDHERVKQAAYGRTPNEDSYAISFMLDDKGKEIFADKTTELMGQSISLMIDGVAVASPGINQPLVDGQASLPGFNNETSLAYAAMMQYGPLPLQLKLEDQSLKGMPLYGANVQNMLIITLAIAVLVIMVYAVITYRLGGLVAVWLMVIQLISVHFLTALLKSGFTTVTLLAIYGSFALLVFALMILFRSMKRDLVRGRAIRQSLKEAFGGSGKVAVDTLVALLMIAVVLIIVDQQQIGAFMRTFAIGILLDLILVGIGLKVLLGSTITIFGTRSSLFTGVRSTKEAVQ